MATDEEVQAGIGRRIAEMRAERSVTQAQVAEALNLAVQYLQVIEAGKQNLTLSTLNRLANYFEVHISEMFAPPKSMQRKVGRPKKPKS